MLQRTLMPVLLTTRAAACLLAWIAMSSVTARADEMRIVSWNAAPSLYEALDKRLSDFTAMADELEPDVLVLVELTGEIELDRIVKALGWGEYHAVVSNWSTLSTQASFALEVAVISKSRILRVTEFDASPDGHHEVLTATGVQPGLVTEEELSASGIPHFGDPLAQTDRGTLRVDLANGLTIFPLHLKSNFNDACGDLGDALNVINRSVPPATPAAQDYLAAAKQALQDGFPAATAVHISNAKKRERVMAAAVRIANAAIADGRTVVIAGDLNTSFEPGRFGSSPTDCTLTDFTCAKGPFPASACRNGDGFDDALGILEAGLVGKAKWKVLSRGLGRTFDDPAFADFAIDHIAVPTVDAGKFSGAQRAAKTYGSDHFPIWTVFKP